MPYHGQAWGLRAELAATDEIVDYIASLELLLTDQLAVDKLSLHHKSLLHYALAQMQDRIQQYGGAAKSLDQANLIQYKLLEQSGNAYQPAYTTRMVDRISNDFGKAIFDSPDISPIQLVEGFKPIFIVGMPRSGTTLVERIIGQNTQVFNGGEQEAMEFVVADFNQRIASGKLSGPKDMSHEQWLGLRSMYLEKLPEISKPIFTDKLPHKLSLIHI